MILSGNEIKACVEKGSIRISPFSEDQVNSASYDIRLGPKVAVYRNTVERVLGDMTQGLGWRPTSAPFVIDTLDEQPVFETEMSPSGFNMYPGIAYLMSTLERISTDFYVPILDGKSSVGRHFISIHETAGFGDAGFDGQFTLEVTCKYPVKIYPGMPIGQIRFETIKGNVTSYKELGHYKDASAEGPVASKLWVQLREHGFRK